MCILKEAVCEIKSRLIGMLSVKNHASHGCSSGESRSFYINPVYELFSEWKRTKTSYFSEHVGHGYPVPGSAS